MPAGNRLMAMAGVFTLLGFLGSFWWMLDLCAHFRLQYFWLFAFMVGLQLYKKKKRLAGLAALGLLVNGMTILPLYIGPAGEAQGAPLKILSYNVNSFNNRYEEVKEYILAHDAHLVFLMEMNQDWMTGLEGLSSKYRVVRKRLRADNFGVVLLARIPVKTASIRNFSKYSPPSIEAVFSWEGREILFYGTHPMPPSRARLAEERDLQLHHTALWIKGQKRPAVVVGDLNATPWSAAFRSFVAESGLLNSQRGYGVQVSWSPMPLLLNIPIDHVLHDPRLVTTARFVGPAMGSDHRPIHVTLAWKKNGEDGP